MRYKKLKLSGLLLFLITVLLTGGCSAESSEKAIESFSDLADKKIGVTVGAIHDKLVQEQIPEAEIVYFNSISDAIAALNAGTIDAFVNPGSSCRILISENENLTMLEAKLKEAEVANVFSKSDKGKKLNAEYSAFIKGLKQSGELSELQEKWFSSTDPDKDVPEYTTDDADKETIVLATNAALLPYDYIQDNEIIGYEIELAARFANEYGYNLIIENMNFDGILPAVSTGKADFGSSAFAITEERKESVDFSETTTMETVALIVRKAGYSGDRSFLDTIRNDFEKTFIREERYKLLLEGMGTTVLINVLSILFGTLLGFGLYMMCRKGGRIANGFARFFTWLIHGLPVVVLLMILYYIIFAKAGISPVLVSVIGFTMIFASAMYSMLEMGVAAVSFGQTEAAYALGFTDTRAFFKIILPQAARHFMPSYKGQIVSLLKATSVVSYISVTDLTRAGDLIRSRTYEPFFSLISIAIIYFVLAGIFNFFFGIVEKKLDPKNRSEEMILKGAADDD